jgi:prevent-host-death family protein
MTMGTRIILPAGKFKATCLMVLDEVAATGRDVLITKRGKPVAVLSPATPVKAAPLAGSVLEEGDLISPLDVHWNAKR